MAYIRSMDFKELSKEIARALEDHKLIAWDQQDKTADIVFAFMKRGIDDIVRDFYD